MKLDWLRPSDTTAPQIWGFRNGIQVGIWPADIEGKTDGGPRGLFRIGYPALNGGKNAGLVNFVAVEPVVDGRRGLSELEHSDLSNKQGKLFWTGSEDSTSAKTDAGSIDSIDGSETLSVTTYIEPFINGARPVIKITFSNDRRDEVQFSVSSLAGGSPMERCVLTATMGNYMRLRRLHLQDHIVAPRDIWPNYNGNAFTEDAFFGAHLLHRNRSGDLIVCATTNEKNPHSVPTDPAAPWWQYRGSFPLTQYWRIPKDTWSEKLNVRVNGRNVYWAGDRPIPGGMAYENFDLVDRFVENQVFVFGLSRKSPEALLRLTSPR